MSGTAKWWAAGGVLVTVGLVLTNPDQAQFEARLGRHLQERVAGAGADTTALGQFAGVVARGLTTAYAGDNTTRSNFGLFSLYSLDLSAWRVLSADVPPSLRFLGIAGMIIPLQ